MSIYFIAVEQIVGKIVGKKLICIQVIFLDKIEIQ
jgi:hypothetical protein